MYAPRRAALLVLCAIAVVLAASLFPASGLGSYPSDVWSGSPGGPPLFSSGGEPMPEQPNPPVQDDPAPNTPTPTPNQADSNHDPQQHSSGDGSLWLLGLLLGFVAILALVFRKLGYRRQGFWLVHPNLPDIPPAFVRNALGVIPKATMGFVVGLSATLPGILDDTTTVFGAAGSAIGMVARGAVRGTVVAFSTLPLLFTAGASGLASGFGSAISALPGAFSSLGGQTSRSWSSDSSPQPTPAGDDTEDGSFGPLSVEEAWGAMTDRVPMRNRDTATPGQYARAAVRRGFPSRSVGTLTRAFQEVRYGDRPGSGERLDAARDAYDDIDEGDDE